MAVLRAIRMNQRGQASLTDALFFLLIVAGLSTLLFMFNTSYGKNVELQLARQYNSDYAQSALKTILYSSVPRNPESSLDDLGSVEEIDYLMAVVKEDFADDGALTETSKARLVNYVGQVMYPLSRTFEYIFSIYILPSTVLIGYPAGDYMFVMLSKTDFPLDPESSEDPVLEHYLCNPPTERSIILVMGDDGIGTEQLIGEDAIDRLLVKVGETAQSNARMDFVKLTPALGGAGAPSQGKVSAQVNLTIWVSTKSKSGFTEDFITNPLDLNCEVFPQP